MNKLKFIHAADLHLDTPFRGLNYLPNTLFDRMKESSFVSLRRIVDIAIEQRVDFILLSGDLYDGAYRSLRAQTRLRKEMERLNNLNINAYIIHGNHDHLGGQWTKLTWPDNTYFFNTEVEMKVFRKNNNNLAFIYGFSYSERSVTTNMTNQYKKQDGAIYHIGMLHGALETNKEHEPYAPFTIKELLEKDFNYWALGHIHKREVLHLDPPIVYSGNIQGRHKKEDGEKGCYLVELNGDRVTHKFFPTNDVQWLSISVSIDEFNCMDNLIKEIEDRKDKVRFYDKGILLSVSLTGVMSTVLQQVEELIDVLNDGEESKSSFVWIFEIKDNTSFAIDRDKLIQESTFVSDLLMQVDQYSDFENAMDSLYQYKYRRYIDNFTDEEKKEILIEAEKLLINKLLK